MKPPEKQRRQALIKMVKLPAKKRQRLAVLEAKNRGLVLPETIEPETPPTN